MSVCPSRPKAWSQNLGHENVLTTYLSYGEVQPHRQTEIFKRLKEPKKQTNSSYDADEIAAAVVRQMKNVG